MPKAMVATVVVVVLCAGCGAQRTATDRAAGETPCTASTAEAPTRAPTPDAAQLATVRAAPTVDAGLQGFVIDFVLAVSTDNEAKARTYYLAPGLYANSKSVRQETGIPDGTEGCGFMVQPLPIEATANRVVFETTIQTGTRTVTKQITLERTPTYWRIVAIR